MSVHTRVCWHAHALWHACALASLFRHASTKMLPCWDQALGGSCGDHRERVGGPDCDSAWGTTEPFILNPRAAPTNVFRSSAALDSPRRLARLSCSAESTS
eukprot:544816-Rhodomonas_salina.1